MSGGRGGKAGYFVFYLQLSFLEAADRIIIGMRAHVLLVDCVLKGRMLGLERFDVVHCAHGRPPGLLRTTEL
jgi:hypothetical protein